VFLLSWILLTDINGDQKFDVSLTADPTDTRKGQAITYSGLGNDFSVISR
jgi:hypothetical protein